MGSDFPVSWKVVPRQVRIKKTFLMSLKVGLAIWCALFGYMFGRSGLGKESLGWVALAAIGGFIYSAIGLLRKREVLRYGTPAWGTVLSMGHERNSGDTMTYEFKDQNGECWRATSTVVILKMKPGDRVALFYLPDDPARSVVYPAAEFELEDEVPSAGQKAA